MQQRFPWFATVMMIIPAALMVLNAISAGAFVRDIGPNETLVWRFDPGWLVNNLWYLSLLTVAFVVLGLRQFLRKMREYRQFERFDEEGFLTQAQILRIESNARNKKRSTLSLWVSLTGGPEVQLKDLPEDALAGRDLGDDIAVYTIPGEPDQLAWAGWIDSPEEHTLPVGASSPSSSSSSSSESSESSESWTSASAAAASQSRTSLSEENRALDRERERQDSLGFADRLLNKVADRLAEQDSVRQALARSIADGSLQPSTALGAIHTKTARIGFLDFFLIGFLSIHGGIFFTVGLVASLTGGAPMLFGGIFGLIGLVEFVIIGFVILRTVRKLGRRARLNSAGETVTAEVKGIKNTNYRINGVVRQALILEIDGETYQHGAFMPAKISHLRKGQSLEIRRDPMDHRSLFIPKL